MAEQSRKQSLTNELDTARTQLASYAGALRLDLDFGARLKASVARSPVPWFAGAALLGLVISRMFGSRRKVVVKAPAVGKDQAAKAGKAAFVLTALKFGLDFAKPVIVTWLRKQATDRWSRRAAAAPSYPPPNR